LYFLDYVGLSRLDPSRVESIVKGVADGCRQAGCALIGGETAELPDLYRDGEYDLAGFAVGVVERARIIDGGRVRPGDVILGLASSGLHSNGYSLARRIVFGVMGLQVGSMLPGVGRSVADELLEPTRIYVCAVREVLSKVEVHAMAHITGGGLPGNVPRVLPEGCRAVLRRRAWHVPPIFRMLAEAGRVSEAEMLRTFNMGIGYVVIVPASAAAEARAALVATGEAVYEVGEIVSGERGVELA
jgi:phosphoribosylformylglycinamidine cyclo-ligase